jgi:anti-sigma factor RsiW
MNQAEIEQLREIARRRRLTPAEQARLQRCIADDPAARSNWEEEIGLTRLLEELPDAPVASNFSARVLGAVERQCPVRRPAPRIVRWFGLHRPAVRAAWICLAAGLIGLSYYGYQAFTRAEMALSLATVAASVEHAAQVVELPTVEVWQDFESIDLLNHTQPQADVELLAVLK